MYIWIQKELVSAVHERQLAEHGGSSGVRDATLLEWALARPQQRYAYDDPQPDLADLAASLAHGLLARDHPFIDGNKRTAAVMCETFVELNGHTLVATDLEMYPQYLGLATGDLGEDEFAAWLRPRLRPREPQGVHEPRGRYKVKRGAGWAGKVV